MLVHNPKEVMMRINEHLNRWMSGNGESVSGIARRARVSRDAVNRLLAGRNVNANSALRVLSLLDLNGKQLEVMIRDEVKHDDKVKGY